MKHLVISAFTGLLYFSQAAVSQTNKYHITAEEQAACGGDAVSLCSQAYPDEDRLIACMYVSKAKLSQGCRTVFNAGLKRRHLM